MSKRDKLRHKLRNNPKGVKFSEIETLLLRFGFVLERVSGSHHVFRFSDGERVATVVVPVHGTVVKSAYTKDVIEILDELFPEVVDEQGKDDDSDA